MSSISFTTASKRKEPQNVPEKVDSWQKWVTELAQKKITGTPSLAVQIAVSGEGKLAKAKNLYSQGKYQEALQSLTESFKKIPVSLKPIYHDFKGDCFSALKEFDLAIQNYFIAENLADYQAKSELLYKIARLRKALNQNNLAREMINKALATEGLDVTQKNRFMAFKAEIDDPKEQFTPEITFPANDHDDRPPFPSISDGMGFSDVDFLLDDSKALRDNPNLTFLYETPTSEELTTTRADQTQDTLTSASISSATFPKLQQELETTSTFADISVGRPGGSVPAIKTYNLDQVSKESSVKKAKLAYRKVDEKLALTKETQPASQLPTPYDTAEVANTNLLKGIARLHLHKFQEAIVCFQEGLKIANLTNVPNLSMQLFYQLGLAYYQQGNFTDCITAWEQCAPLVKDSLQFKAQLICSLALTYIQIGKPVHAEMLLQKAIKTEFSGSEKGMLILCLAEILLNKKEYLKTCELLLTAIEANSTFPDETNLQFCNMLIRISRETNDDKLYEKIKDIGMGFTNTTIETKISFLFESALMEEAQGYDSAAMEIYQVLLTQNLAPDIALTIGKRVAELKKRLE